MRWTIVAQDGGDVEHPFLLRAWKLAIGLAWFVIGTVRLLGFVLGLLIFGGVILLFIVEAVKALPLLPLFLATVVDGLRPISQVWGAAFALYLAIGWYLSRLARRQEQIADEQRAAVEELKELLKPLVNLRN